ncbi:hypothetical protein GCM10008915_57690 [Bifidobacterium pullorum subsp. gallinarum]
MMSRCFKPILFPKTMATMTPKVIKPSPPIWINIIMMTCPKVENTLPVSKTTSPFTHIADVAVNNASSRPTELPVEEEWGSASNAAPININVKKTSMMS